MVVYIVIGGINMLNAILKAFQSDEVMYISSILSSAFMFVVLIGAIAINAWILVIRLLDYKRMK